MADLRDGFTYAVLAYLESGEFLQLTSAPADCCPGRIQDGPAGCTCWVPEFDKPQTQPDEMTVARLALGEIEPEVRDHMCDDCAYRPNSPEKSGDADHAMDAEQLEQLAATGQRFWCHDGMPQPIAWRHPAGMRIPAHPDRTGDYQPLQILGTPYRADGRPGLICAGWSARRRALTAKDPK